MNTVTSAVKILIVVVIVEVVTIDFQALFLRTVSFKTKDFGDLDCSSIRRSDHHPNHLAPLILFDFFQGLSYQFTEIQDPRSL